MRMRVEDAYILKCNVSLEYEGGEKRILAFFFFLQECRREKPVKTEGNFIEDRVYK